MVLEARRFPNCGQRFRKTRWRFVNRRSLFHQCTAMGTREQIITYWLCPAEPARSHFAAVISNLAARFDAAVFEPHVTISVTSAEQEKPAIVLAKVLPGYRRFRLEALGLGYSHKFTKTLFVRFADHADLTGLSEDLRRASGSPSDYELNPHLSLLYKTMDSETKRELARSTALPFGDATFDTVKAVLSPARIESPEDVESWRVIAEERLGR
jgi:Cyclic phosphodiesterase-like protein